MHAAFVGIDARSSRLADESGPGVVRILEAYLGRFGQGDGVSLPETLSPEPILADFTDSVILFPFVREELGLDNHVSMMLSGNAFGS